MGNFNVVPLESEIESKFARWATLEGLSCVKLNLQGRRGWPDRLVMGTFPKIIFIEFKRKGEKTRKLQDHVHEQLGKKGWKVFTVESVEDAKALCERHLL